jgi:hypothetical protein
MALVNKNNFSIDNKTDSYITTEVTALLLSFDYWNEIYILGTLILG